MFSIASFASVIIISTPVGITRTSLTLVFSISDRIAKKPFKNNEKK